MKNIFVFILKYRYWIISALIIGLYTILPQIMGGFIFWAVFGLMCIFICLSRTRNLVQNFQNKKSFSAIFFIVLFFIAGVCFFILSYSDYTEYIK